jgi:hypothetical protein
MVENVEKDLQEVKEKANDRRKWINKGQIFPVLN